MTNGNQIDEDGIENLTHLLGKAIYPKIAYRGDVLGAIDAALHPAPTKAP